MAAVPAGGRLDRIPLAVNWATGQPCLAAYLAGSEGGAERPYGLMVLTVGNAEIAAITGFPDPALFAAFGLASSIGAVSSRRHTGTTGP